VLISLPRQHLVIPSEDAPLCFWQRTAQARRREESAVCLFRCGQPQQQEGFVGRPFRGDMKIKREAGALAPEVRSPDKTGADPIESEFLSLIPLYFYVNVSRARCSQLDARA
jgi:hypothetical protein